MIVVVHVCELLLVDIGIWNNNSPLVADTLTMSYRMHGLVVVADVKKFVVTDMEFEKLELSKTEEV